MAFSGFLTILVQYRHLLEFAHQDEQAVLDYLKLVHDLPPDLSEGNLQLIREDAAGKIAHFTGLSIRDILDTAREITANGLIATVRQLDHLVRIRRACQTLQLGTSAALELGRLRGNSPREAYRLAAEGALNSLTAQLEGQVSVEQGELGQSETSWIVVDTQRLVARSADKARFMLTLKNFLGEPMVDVHVGWETSLSRLGSPSSDSTDQNGQVWIELEAGQEMGNAQVTARYGLDRQVLAPLILIDCQVETLFIQDPVRTPDEALAGNLKAIDFRLQVFDQLGNIGRDQLVQWSTDLGTFERPQSRTDAEGFATARLRSLSSGEATVMAELAVNGELEAFDPVTFLEQLYFQYVRFSGPVATGQTATATCRVVNLDGSPQRNVTVLWSADFGGFDKDPAQSISDDNGIAVIGYLAQEPGTVTLTVNAKYDNKDLQPLSSERTTVHLLPSLVEMEPAEQFYALYQARPAAFQVRLEPAAAGYPVTWWAGETLLTTTYTNGSGMASYQRHFNEAQLGEQVVTVRSIRANDAFDFKVTVVMPHDRLVPRIALDSPGMVLVEEARWVFACDPGLVSTLHIFAERDEGLGDDGASFTLALGSYADPVALGVVFDPPLGQTLHCDPEGKAILKIDCTKAAFLANSDPHNNHMRLTVTSNLGLSLDLWVGLRYLLDLEHSVLHFFKGKADIGYFAGLAGRLRRLNEAGPMILRESARRLRLILDGGRDPAEVDLLAYEGDNAWLPGANFISLLTPPGNRCTFEALGDLVKRIQFVGATTYDAQNDNAGATLELSVTSDPGLIEDAGRFIADHGGRYRFRLTLRNEGGFPIAGVPLLPAPYVAGGAQYISNGITDAQGVVDIEVDTGNAVTGQDHRVLINLGHLTRYLSVHVYEVVDTEARLSLNELNQVKAVVTFRRRNGGAFRDIGQWYGYVRTTDQTVPIIQPHQPQSLTITTPWMASDMPGTWRVGLSTPTSEHRWLIGDIELPINEDLPEGDTP